MITDEQRRQYVDEGYFVLEGVIPNDHLQILRDSCDHLIDLMHQEMDRLGTDHIHISHRGKRYHIAKQYDKPPRLTEYVFSQLMADVCRATIGETAFLFYDQYVVKAAEQGIKFSWHQDSGYLDFNHQPYVTVWAAVDDMTLENGTAYVLPFSKSGRTVVTPESELLVQEGNNPIFVVESGVSIGEVVKALNALGVSPRDLISIFQALKAAGALQAELEII